MGRPKGRCAISPAMKEDICCELRKKQSIRQIAENISKKWGQKIGKSTIQNIKKDMEDKQRPQTVTDLCTKKCSGRPSCFTQRERRILKKIVCFFLYSFFFYINTQYELLYAK